MLELVNLSNTNFDTETLFQGNTGALPRLLEDYHLDGIEMLFCEPWNRIFHPADCIKGVHLRFWPSWMDFWRGNLPALLSEYGNREQIIAQYGGLHPEDWLALWRENIRQAVASGAEYFVFHVGQARRSELYSRRFAYSDGEVIDAAAALINDLADVIPDDWLLLFENLWWPGLTFQDAQAAARLLEKVHHRNSGFMLDTGHLMNTALDLTTEEDGIDYILETIKRLGSLRGAIKGIHLHQSLSGPFVRQKKEAAVQPSMSGQEIMKYIIAVDQHHPFHSSRVQEIIELVKPEFLVHEFIQYSYEDWVKKIICQQHALGLH